MEDYPRTLRELEARFATEQACREYLARLRWGQEFVCPACDGTEAWPTARGLWMCAACGHQASVIAGTIFQGTRTPLSVWFRAIWWVVSQKNGASALGLQRVLGLGSYRTAWTWLHKLRRAMVRPGRDRVSEEVEVDETLVGGLEAGGGRRHLGKKALVVIAAEVRGRAIGRIRMQRVADASADSLLTFVQHAVQPGSVVITDGLQSYRRLPKRGYRHDRRVLLGRGESAEAVLPRVHRVASLLKRWLLGHIIAARPRPIHEVPPYDIMVTPVQVIFPAFRVAHGPQSIHDEGDPVRIQSGPLWKHLQKCVRCSMSPCHDVGMRGRRVLQIEWAFLLTVVRIGARGRRSRSTDLPYRSRSRPASPASGTRSPAYRTDPLYSTLRCLSGTHQRDLAVLPPSTVATPPLSRSNQTA